MASDDRHQLIALESLRGIAGMLVIAAHVAYIPALHWPPVASPVLAPSAIYCVPMFFTLSAFVMWYGYADGGRVRRGALHFYRRRFFRIAPLYYVLLFLYIGVVYPWDFIWPYLWSASTLIFNLVPGHHVGIVVASWSLGVEIVFYALFPLLVRWVRTLPVAIALFVATALWAVPADREFAGVTRFEQLLPWDMAKFDVYASSQFNMLFFAGGIVAAMLLPRLWSERGQAWAFWLFWASAVAIVVLVATSALGLHDLFGLRPVWAIVMGALILSVSVRPPAVLQARPIRWLGKVSLSIYLVHALVVVYLDRYGVFAWLDRTLGGWGYVAAVGIVSVITIAIASLTYRFIEAPFMGAGGRAAVPEQATAATE